jgi:hypothetical protein
MTTSSRLPYEASTTYAMERAWRTPIAPADGRCRLAHDSELVDLAAAGRYKERSARPWQKHGSTRAFTAERVGFEPTDP